MSTKEFLIGEELVNYIESLDFELRARKDVVAFMLSSNMPTDTEAFEKYQKELVEFTIQFDTAKKELEDTYIPNEWKKHNTKWSLNYVTQTMTVEKLCDCEETSDGY